MKKLLKKLKFMPRFAAWLAATIIRIWAWTQRIEFVDPNGYLDDKREGALIFSIWHNRLILMAFLIPAPLRKRVLFLTSRSKDGEIIARVLEKSGMVGARGSTSKKGVDKGGARALVEMRRWLRTGNHVAITPDGPRGPKYEIQPGAIWLASKSGCPIVPVSFNSRSHLELGTWDNTQLARPFSKGEFVLGDAIEIPADLGTEDVEKYQIKVRDAILKITRWDKTPHPKTDR